MKQIKHLNDTHCRNAIVRLTTEAIRLWAPDGTDPVTWPQKTTSA